MLNVPDTQLARGARLITDRLQAAGHQAVWAGGCVRDLLAGLDPKDFDIATAARPEAVQSLFPRSKAVGKAFGVILVSIGGNDYHVATFRKDLAYADGRRPEGVLFADAREDAERRDFTMNALFFDPASRRILDYVNGQSDLAAGLVRCVGDPEERFAEDYLRMIRAVRFAAALDFRIDPGTAGAIRTHSSKLAQTAAERIQAELTRILLEAVRPGDALVLMHDLGILKAILPEVEAMAGQAQPPLFHPEGDVLTHTVLMLNAMRDRSLRLAYSALLHDVGKPPTAMNDGARIRFNNHASVGAEMARLMLRRLKFKADDIDAVCHVISNHMRFMMVRNMRRATLIRMTSAPTFPVELEMHKLDCLASHGDLSNYEFLTRFMEERASEPALPKPWVTGRDLMAAGIAEGKRIGEWKHKAYELQLEGAFANREEALEWLNAEIKKGLPPPGAAGDAPCPAP